MTGLRRYGEGAHSLFQGIIPALG